jgi:exopolysaccharide biosynthesis polyprenyl glycosylphosphotransferase
MLSNRSIGIRTMSLLALLALVSIGFWGWLYIWEDTLFFQRRLLEPYLLYNEFLLIGILFGLGGKRRLDGPHYQFINAMRQSGRQALLGLFAVVLVVFAMEDTTVSRTFFFSYVPWLYLTLLVSNYLLPMWLGQMAFSGDRAERVALAGTVEQARRFLPWLDRKSSLGLRAVGLVCLPPLPPDAESPGRLPFPVLGSMDEIGEILQKAAITQLVVLDLNIGVERLRRVAQLCEGSAVRLIAVHDLDSYFNHTTITFEDDGVRFVGLREEPLESPLNRVLKRLTDMAIAGFVVVVILPLVTAAVWLVQRFQSRGPVFFKQSRSGLLGRPFTIYKFRTMHTNNRNEAAQASKGDPRIYPAGRWLRKYSIDELPQFINVLRGQMSIVGPRPHLEKHEEMWMRAMRRYVVRRFIRPGITGWAQVNGFRGEIHSEADIEQRVDADIYYLENWSFSLDCVVMFKTIKECILPPRSAY